VTKLFIYLLRSATPGFLLATAWLFPLTLLSPVAGWLSILGFSRLIRQRSYFGLWFAGVISHGLAFYWLFFTIQDFGKFRPEAAAALFALFLASHSLHFPLIGVVINSLPRRLELLGVAAPFGWLAGEVLFPRIFPWALGHTQLLFPTFAQVADIGGVSLISFVMVWIAAGIEKSLSQKRIEPSLVVGLGTFIIILLYGTVRLEQFSNKDVASQSVVIVQANISTEEKNNVRLVKTNEKRYIELTKPFQGRNSLIVWPESVVQRWIPVNIGTIETDPILQTFHGNTALLVGGLTYSSREAMHNSALAIKKDGSVPTPYHKQVLMPFGEYIPFAETFPFIKKLAAHMGGFTPGKAVKIFHYPALARDTSPVGLSVSPLICYEDLLPRLSRNAVDGGAMLLVNLTNDAWFGNTPALLQHHLIAAFRAIETRRTLIRSTNTGFSSAIDPRGKIIAELAPETEGALEMSVPLLNTKTFWVRYPVEALLFWLSVILVALSAITITKSRKQESRGWRYRKQ
jgi:apolipoprotein N-acyltransferase